MAGYILDQGRALRQSFAERACFVDPMIELFQNQDIRKVYFLGSGTSYHAALSFKNWFEKYLKVEAAEDGSKTYQVVLTDKEGTESTVFFNEKGEILK